MPKPRKTKVLVQTYLFTAHISVPSPNVLIELVNLKHHKLTQRRLSNLNLRHTLNNELLQCPTCFSFTEIIIRQLCQKARADCLEVHGGLAARGGEVYEITRIPFTKRPHELASL